MRFLRVQRPTTVLPKRNVVISGETSADENPHGTGREELDFFICVKSSILLANICSQQVAAVASEARSLNWSKKHTRCLAVTLVALLGDQIYDAITLINFDYFHLPVGLPPLGRLDLL